MSTSLGINIAKLVTSKVGAQAIAIATAPIIARLYLPEAFGVRQIFVSIAGIIIVVSCLRYELSIPLGKDEKEAAVSLALSLVFTLVFTLAARAVVLLPRGVLARRFNAPELKGFCYPRDRCSPSGLTCRISARIWPPMTPHLYQTILNIQGYLRSEE